MLRLLYFVAVALLSLSLSLNVVLLQNAQTRPANRVRFAEQSRWPAIVDQATGLRLEPQGETWMYVFAPKCGWCNKDYDNLIAVGKSEPGRNIVGLVLSENADGLDEYLLRKPFPGRVAIIDTSGLPQDFVSNLRVTPQWVVINSDRRVLKSWEGAVIPSRLVEANKFFRVDLPGTTDSLR